MQARLFPDGERLSAVMAITLLAYAGSRFIQAPGQVLALELAGIYLPLQMSVNTAVALFVAGLTAAGVDWMLQSEDGAPRTSRFRHWTLPAMTAWVLSLLLGNLTFDLNWWATLALCTLLLLAVIMGEFASAQPEHRYHWLASVVLRFLMLGLFLILAITVRAVGLRLFLALPAVALGAFAAFSRMQLLLPGQAWRPVQMAGLTFLCVQVAAALHYLPFSALGYGLALLGLVFALNHFVSALNLEQPWLAPAREGLITLGIFWALALLVR
ncbi:MAG: hypothetical protein KIT46_02935 [Anaerolineales bacterium]|nr:hypothetical protein [Anaerolineales bacterium]MCW5854980.1 hypothetical protein [Anaerolineales bacterium]